MGRLKLTDFLFRSFIVYGSTNPYLVETLLLDPVSIKTTFD